MRISRAGYTACPGCLSHVKVEPTMACPFCGEQLRDKETLGATTMERLRGSRTALLALGLAGGVAFAIACGDAEPKDPAPNSKNNENNANSLNNGTPVPVYGTFNLDNGPSSQDTGLQDTDSHDAGSQDVDDDVDVDGGDESDAGL